MATRIRWSIWSSPLFKDRRRASLTSHVPEPLLRCRRACDCRCPGPERHCRLDRCGVNVDRLVAFWDQQGQEDAHQRQAGQDIKDRVHPETGGQEQTAEQRAADPPQPAEARSPRDRSRPASWSGSGSPPTHRSRIDVPVVPKPTRRRKRTGSRSSNVSKAMNTADQEAHRHNRFGPQPVGAPGGRQRPAIAPPLSTRRKASELVFKPDSSISTGNQMLGWKFRTLGEGAHQSRHHRREPETPAEQACETNFSAFGLLGTLSGIGTPVGWETARALSS